ncbi:MAG: PAS domain S-box protein [Candidatus Competibacteraceae bacterium]|nr:MAG: PAS domain S-box protein [Candidatus Competibacteraceae bacterium]
MVIASTETLSMLQSLKGGLFIVVTSIGLYALLRVSYRRLADSEARYRSVVEDMPGLLCRFQPDGILEYVNEAYASAFGQQPEALLGRSFLAFIPEQDRAAVRADIEALTPESPVVTHEYPVIGAGGEIRWQRWSNRLLTDKAGHTIGYQSFGLDITAYKQADQALRESEERYRMAQRLSGIGLWEWNIATHTVYWSNEMLAIRGFNPSEFGGLFNDVATWVHPDDQARWRESVRACVEDGKEYRMESRIVRPDGEVRWIAALGNAERDEDGKARRMMGVVLDITARKQTEEALRASEERLRLFIEHAPTALAMFDRQMRYLAVSRRWTMDYGLEGRDIIGQSHYTIFPEIPDHWKAVHRRGMEDEVVQANEDRFERLDGTVQWLRWVVRPWHTDDGAVGGIVIFTEDITEHKQAEQALWESRQRLFRALENIPDMVVIYDRDLRIQYINVAARTITGRPTTDFIGRRDDEIWPPHIYNTYLPTLKKALAEGTIESLESDLTLANGQARSLHITCVPLQDERGDVREILGITRDLTVQKTAERSIRQINQELEERVCTRTAELTAANERLQELDRLKSLFIASMSHELRTPLNSIIGFTGMIVGDMAGPISERQRDYLQRAYRAGKHLLGLITDIIDISKIEAGKLAIEYGPFNLDKVMSDAMASMEAGAREKGLALTLEMPEGITLHTDRKRLLQCLLNLLSNAVKYTERGSVRIMVQCNDAHIEITVSDTGIGIPESAQNQLFQPFVRLDSKLKNHASGTGLGLYLTRKLAREILGGDLTISHRQDEGSAFSLRVARRMSRENHPGEEEARHDHC